MQVGTSRDQGLYNKPSAAVHPGALAAETLSQYNTSSVQWIVISWEVLRRGAVESRRSFVGMIT